MTDTRFDLVQGCCFAELAKLPANSIDCLISDPPYLTTNLPFDKQRIDWTLWWREINRVCKPTAVQVCFAAGLFTVDLIQANRKNYRYDLVWSKPQSVGFLSANMRPLRAHESILVFCRKFGRLKSTGKMQSTYNPQMTEGAPYHHRKRTKPTRHYTAAMNDTDYDNPGTRHPTSVLTFARDRNGQHPTQKPEELCRKLVKSYSNVGDVILDPFMGSGSSGVAALLEGRKFIGIERDPEYYAVAYHRLKEAAEGRA